MTLIWNRPTGLHVEQLADSTLVYDLAGAQVHCLTDHAKAVFCAAQNATTEEIAQAAGLSLAQAQAELASLHDRGLLIAPTVGLSRKAMVAGAVGAGLGIWTMAAPSAAMASSIVTLPATGSGPVAPPPPPGGGGGGTTVTPPQATVTPVTGSVANPSTGRS